MALSVTGRPVAQSTYTGISFNALKRTARNGSAFRAMNQINSFVRGKKPLEYLFLYAPASFTHEGYGVNLNEIQRPYLAPIVDVTGGKARKASFQFIITDADDSFFTAVDDEISYVQAFADNGIPVSFNSVHKQLDSSFWYIDNMTFTHARSNLAGRTVSAQCDVSLTEYLPSSKNFIQLPRFKYGNITQITKKKITTPGVDPDDIAAALKG
jgi:hypothetical protein